MFMRGLSDSVQCETNIGWFYEEAFEESQKYKVRHRAGERYTHAAQMRERQVLRGLTLRGGCAAALQEGKFIIEKEKMSKESIS
jgi:hypothetical protein